MAKLNLSKNGKTDSSLEKWIILTAPIENITKPQTYAIWIDSELTFNKNEHSCFKIF